jgi:dipeptidyl aminopeptidase/acylaminoacyl peptidase
MLRVIAILAAAACLHVSSAIAQSRTAHSSPLSLEDLMKTEFFVGPGAISPDGNFLAFSTVTPAGLAELAERTPNNTVVAAKGYWGTSFRIINTRDDSELPLSPRLKALGQNPSWSPDGKTLAFFADSEHGRQLWSWSVETRQARLLTSRLAAGRRIVWSPNSLVVFAGLEPSASSEGASSLVHNDGNLAADSSGAMPKVFRSDEAQATFPNLPRWNSSSRQALFKLYELSAIDIKTGNSTYLAPISGGGLADLTLSPDGAHLAFSGAPKAPLSADPSDATRDLMIVDTNGARGPFVVAPGFSKSSYSTLRWAPDSKRIAFYSKDRIKSKSSASAQAGFLSVAAWEDGRIHLEAWSELPPVQDFLWSSAANSLLAIDASGGLWSLNRGKQTPISLTQSNSQIKVRSIVADWDRATFLSPDSGVSAIILATNPKSQNDSFWKINLRDGKLVKLQEEQRQYGVVETGQAVREVLFNSRNNSIYYVSQDASVPPEVYRTCICSNSTPKRVTHVNAALDRYSFGIGRIVSYRSSAGGEDLMGALILPPGYENHLPLATIVEVYPHSAINGREDMIREFGSAQVYANFPVQYFVTRGYAVFFPTFSAGGPGQQGGIPQRMRGVLNGVMPAIDKVIDMGIADRGRIGVSGHSYGGYSTLSLLVQTKRFKAGVMLSGASDLTSHFLSMSVDTANMPGAEVNGGTRDDIGGTPWTVPESYRQNSPIWYLDRIETPLLILHGEKDEISPIQAEEVFVGLTQLHKRVEYRRYPGENHVFFREASVKDALDSMMRWFDTYLGVTKVNVR